MVRTCVDADMVLVVGGRGKRPATALSCAQVGSFPSVSANMNFADIGRREGTVTPLKWALEGTLA